MKASITCGVSTLIRLQELPVFRNRDHTSQGCSADILRLSDDCDAATKESKQLTFIRSGVFLYSALKLLMITFALALKSCMLLCKEIMG